MKLFLTVLFLVLSSYFYYIFFYNKGFLILYYSPPFTVKIENLDPVTCKDTPCKITVKPNEYKICVYKENYNPWCTNKKISLKSETDIFPKLKKQINISDIKIEKKITRKNIEKIEEKHFKFEDDFGRKFLFKENVLINLQNQKELMITDFEYIKDIAYFNNKILFWNNYDIVLFDIIKNSKFTLVSRKENSNINIKIDDGVLLDINEEKSYLDEDFLLINLPIKSKLQHTAYCNNGIYYLNDKKLYIYENSNSREIFEFFINQDIDFKLKCFDEKSLKIEFENNKYQIINL